jgi:hypothetical protein
MITVVVIVIAIFTEETVDDLRVTRPVVNSSPNQLRLFDEKLRTAISFKIRVPTVEIDNFRPAVRHRCVARGVPMK